MNVNKSMLLVTSTWNGTPTFRMIPVSISCPFNEAIFAVGEKTLAIVSKDKKQAFQLLPKLNPQGDYETPKKPRANRSPYCEERKAVEAYYEYYITEESEIKDFVNMFALNADSFDYLKFYPAPDAATDIAEAA